MAKANKALEDKIRLWWEHPVAFVRDCFEVEPDPWQFDVLEAFPTTPLISMQACRGPGKTATLAWLGWNFLLTRPYPNIAATAISGDNLRDNLWKEMALWRAKDKTKILSSLYEITSERIFRKGFKDTWFMSARTWPKSGDMQAQSAVLSGLHADYVMFILDESGEIPVPVGVTAEAALLSGKEAHVVQAGNPTTHDGYLYSASRDKRWKVFEITGDPDDPKRAPRVNIDEARRQIQRWGRDNPWVMSGILGKFPPSNLASLISEDEVRAAMNRHYRTHEIGAVAKIIGVDVARQGLDASVISMRQGIQAYPFRRFRNIDGIVGASITNNLWDEFQADACFVDATGGLGFTWIDQLRTLGKSPLAVQFSSKAADEDRFVNKRAEMYWRAVQWIKNGGALPGEFTEGARELMDALCKTQMFHKNDRIQLEEKEQIRDRLGFSPDEADSFVVGFAETVTPAARSPRGNYSAVRQEYRPFAEVERGTESGYSGGQNFDPYRTSYR